MSKPYIYVMPQAFIEDNDVPARWRVWGYINGFFVNNQTCWASNETIGEKIRAHKDTVSKAVGELEEMGLISCERTRRTRLISPKIRREIGIDAYQEPSPTPISDRHERLSISDSISDSLIGAHEDVPRASNLSKLFRAKPSQEEEPVRAVSKISEKEKLAYIPLVRWAESERGFPFLTTEVGKQLKALKLAKQNGLTGVELKERWEELSTDKFWSVNGFDWMNVVQSFNKRRDV